MKRQLSQWILLFTAITAVISSTLRLRRPAPLGDERDRGAVSLEQVLWFVAAGVAVAVVAGTVWPKIRDQANTDPAVPGAPSPATEVPRRSPSFCSRRSSW